MALALAEILREHWHDYAAAHRSRLTGDHYRAVRHTLACRTPELGGHLYQCTNKICGQKHYAYHSCNNRNCTQCGARDQQLWTAKQEAKLLRVPYFMITFTIPQELRSLCLHQPKILSNLLLKYSAQALTDIAHTKLKNNHLQLGITSVLHTWDRRAGHHPHVHCIVPAVAYDREKNSLIHPPKPDEFLVHFLPLAARFRSLIHTALKTKHSDLYQNLTPDQRRALAPTTQWNVQVKPVGKGATALRYLARYIHRSAFTARRILGKDAQDRIRLRWTDSKTKKTSILPLEPHEFLRRWCLHVLPKGFVRVRHYGFLAPAAKKARANIRLLLKQAPESIPELPQSEPFTCPHCQSELRFLKTIPRPRGPPSL